ncbi:glycosyltransferase [Granulicella mallensis]|uniref:Glycosyltransferase, MGT family n=1 Tax=Granulicella mallensis (strain ATCC BAA-1857 / DSM 23137 / MP5ACTX8) TaxID=682795 RepID=G8NWF0_GRAMM|nr:glycosyltransferase [Granulicella mallensis]AEU37753.1 glycosyltransferase, MGT family [Granulicella mallensis MP5ACTX8]
MKIGFISMPLTGHLNPMIALARKLQFRGHEIVFIGIPDVGPYARAAGLNFVSYCEEELPAGSSAGILAPAAKLHGMETTRWTIQGAGRAMFQLASQHLPRVIAETGVEALVFDTIHMYLEVVPMSLGIPYAHVWAILNIDFSGATLPSVVSGRYEDTPEARVRNTEDLKKSDNAFFGIVQPLAEEYAERAGLKLDWSDPAATVSRHAVAVVSQTPKEFDLPGIPWPPQFHYAGPFFDDAGREPIPFPWEKLDGRPLVYASLGTLVNGLDSIYKTILPAVGRMPEIQVVLSKGSNIDLADLGPIPSNVIVVDKAPQLELLKRSVLCITHAGLNTALESLALGVPMVAIPIGYDQFGVAIRLAYHGVGEALQLDDLTIDGLHELIQKVLHTPGYNEKAQYFRDVIAKRRGLDVAAEAIERAFEQALENRPLELSHA